MRRDLEKRGGVFRFKEFNENPKLLERYLDGQVGRPWDKVYSEICSNSDSRRGIGRTVLTRIRRLVASDCFTAGRQVLQPGWFGPHPPSTLYVHPKTGLLCRPRPRRYDRPKPEITRIALDSLHWYEKTDGIWYRLDHEVRQISFFGVEREEIVQIRKQQCSKKELARIAASLETGRDAYYQELRFGKLLWIPVLGPKPRR